jgi:hypothetical protein
MRVLRLRLQPHEVNDVDHPDLQGGQMLAHDQHGGERLERGHVATAGHHHVGCHAPGLRDDQKAKNQAVFSYRFSCQLAYGTVQSLRVSHQCTRFGTEGMTYDR